MGTCLVVREVTIGKVVRTIFSGYGQKSNLWVKNLQQEKAP